MQPSRPQLLFTPLAVRTTKTKFKQASKDELVRNTRYKMIQEAEISATGRTNNSRERTDHGFVPWRMLVLYKSMLLQPIYLGVQNSLTQKLPEVSNCLDTPKLLHEQFLKVPFPPSQVTQPGHNGFRQPIGTKGPFVSTLWRNFSMRITFSQPNNMHKFQQIAKKNHFFILHWVLKNPLLTAPYLIPTRITLK